MQHIRTLFHEFNFTIWRILVLTILNWIRIEIAKLFFRSQERWFNEINHAVVYKEGEYSLYAWEEDQLMRVFVDNLHSFKLFWIGVPVRIILRLVLIWFTAKLVADFRFLIMWPSSQITKSEPGKCLHLCKSYKLIEQLRDREEPATRV